MNRRPLLFFTVVTSLVAILAVTAIATPAGAQASHETLTAQATLTTPGGHALTGTMVTQRTLGATVSSTWTFTGMYEGLPVYAEGTAVERWLGNGKHELTVTSVTQATLNGKEFARHDLLLQTVEVEQAGPGLVTLAGVPLAISGPLMPPGSGDMSYVLTSAGQGGQPITDLPNTAAVSIPAESGLSLLFVLVTLGLNGAIAMGALVWRRANVL